MTVPNPRGIREKRPKSGSFPVNTGELETMSLVLFSAVICEKTRMNLISKTIKYKLDSSSKMQFAFLYPKDIQKNFWKTIDFVENLEMTQIAGGGGSCSLRHYDTMRTKIDM